MNALRWLALAALVTAATACGDDSGNNNTPDAQNIDAAIDAPAEVTFTSYVLDLVLHQTADNTDPKPFSDFSNLPDPDQDNPNAYEALFP
ncbi:MAG TPA: hypothetical protein VHE35_15560 [Kofleriaceae bacterium]|nr:hypothetical protein [Kofleriaceae bacterium]